MFSCSACFSCVFDDIYQNVLVLLLFLPRKISGCEPVLRHYSFCKILHLKCLTVFWIRLGLNNFLVICTITLSNAPYQTHPEFWHIRHSVFFRQMPAYSIILSAIKVHSHISKNYQGIFRFIQAYSTPSVTLAYSEPWYILNPGIFRAGILFKSLWNIGQAYSEPCYRALFSHIQAY